MKPKPIPAERALWENQARSKLCRKLWSQQLAGEQSHPSGEARAREQPAWD